MRCARLSTGFVGSILLPIRYADYAPFRSGRNGQPAGMGDKIPLTGGSLNPALFPLFPIRVFLFARCRGTASFFQSCPASIRFHCDGHLAEQYLFEKTAGK